MADAADLKSAIRESVRVRVPFSAPLLIVTIVLASFGYRERLATQMRNYGSLAQLVRAVGS